MKIVIILPTYNEKGNIGELIPILEEEIFPMIKNHEMNILVADDSSPDGTVDEVRELMKKYKNIDLNIGVKKGLGAAYIRGITYAIDKMKADIIFEMDADGQHDPKKIPEFLKKIEEGYDMVIGNRYSDGGSIPPNWPIKRKIFSVFGNLLVRSILMRFNIHDWTGGYRALKKEVFLKEKSKLGPFPSYTFQIAFLHKAVQDGFKIGEVPFHFTDRTLGKSKFPAVEYIYNALKYVVIARILELKRFIKFLVVGGLGFVINAIALRLLVESYNWHPASANLAGAVLAIFSNYNFNNIWTFKEETSKGILSYLTKLVGFYISSSIGVVLIQTGTIYLGTHLIGRTYYFIYFLVGTGFLLIWNFTMYRKVIWRKKTQQL
ncbi:MAG: glycosyltransferase [Candidatus Levybacteria bacterium]|nr:glycosyltransferase [Candidatus Levybacteria bacterium]